MKIEGLLQSIITYNCKTLKCGLLSQILYDILICKVFYHMPSACQHISNRFRHCKRVTNIFPFYQVVYQIVRAGNNVRELIITVDTRILPAQCALPFQRLFFLHLKVISSMFVEIRFPIQILAFPNKCKETTAYKFHEQC